MAIYGHPIPDAFPQFNKKYGVLGDNGEYQVPAAWQAGLSNVSLLLEIPGSDAYQQLK
jgi:hypothetical protein